MTGDNPFPTSDTETENLAVDNKSLSENLDENLDDLTSPLLPSTRSFERSIEEVENLIRQIDESSAEIGEASREVFQSYRDLGHRVVASRQWPRQLAILTASAASLLYLVFRVLFTLNLANPFAIAFSITLLAAEAYGLFHLSLFFYQVWQLVEPPIQEAMIGHTVDVFVTTYNEDVDLLRNTLRACVDMQYPHTTYVLDDGQRDTVRVLAESLGVRYITRTEHAHAKAGNVNNALRQTTGEFVIILDADHVPHLHFIMRMIGYFNDPRVGFVQAPHTTYNLDNFLGIWNTKTRIYWEDVRIFFEAVQLGKNRHGVACFCGSATMFRRKALEDVGLFATETITEDLHTGMRINAAGWKSLAIGEELVVGLAPEDAQTSSIQRLRWGEGNLSVLAYDNPLTMKGLRLPGRINYLAAILNWTYGPARLVMYLVPIVMLFSGVAPVAHFSAVYVAVVLFYLFSIWTAVKMASNKCGDLIGIELSMMSAFHVHIQAIWRALFRRRFQRFVVTAKRRPPKTSVLRRMWPQVAIVTLGLVAIGWAAARVSLGLSLDYFGLIVGSFLALYHAWLGFTVLRQATRQRDPDAQWRHPIHLHVDYRYENNTGGIKTNGNNKGGTKTVSGRAATLNLNESGASLLTRDRLPVSTPIEITVESPFANATCSGVVTGTKELKYHDYHAYVQEIAFHNLDPIARQAEIDAVSKLLFGFVVPWTVKEYRGTLMWMDLRLSRLDRKRQIPLPLEIRSPASAVPWLHSVVREMDQHGLTTILGYPLEEGSSVEITIQSPGEDLVAKARVVEVQSIAIGVTVVYRHRFQWIEPTPAMLPSTIRWMEQPYRHELDPANKRPKRPVLTAKNAVWTAAATVLVLVSAGLFWATHRNELLLIAATKRPLTPNEIQRLEAINESVATTRYISPNRLLRRYKAALAANQPRQAAELATRLAEEIPENRCRWQAASATHWAQSDDYRQADRILKELIASGCERFLPEEERATIYLQAARVAIAVGSIERSAGLFTKASHLKSLNSEQIDEYIGLLITANKLPQAFRLLKQMDPNDQILRRIVEVYEIAQQPQQAFEALKTLHARNPNDADVLRRLAEIAFLREETEPAIEYYRDLRKLQPENAEVPRRLAGIFTQLGRTDEAIELLRDATDAESLMLLSSILETTNQYEEALDRLRQVTGEATETPGYQEQLVRLLLATRRYDEAVRLLAVYLKSHPENRIFQQSFINAIAASDLDWFNSRLVDPESLQSTQKTLREIYDQYRTTDFEPLDLTDSRQLAYALQRLGMTEESIEVLTHAVDHHPTSRPLRLQLAQSLSALHRYQDAETQYLILLENAK